MDRQMLIASRLKQAREESGLSQADLGNMFGTSDVNISRMERGIVKVNIPDLERFGVIFNKPLEWFLSDQVETEPRPLGAILIEAQKVLERTGLITLPRRGSVPAGVPFTEEQETGDYDEVPREVLGSTPAENAYTLKINGDSLIGDKIYSGDTAVVDSKATDIVDGKIYIVRIGNEVCARHVHKQNGHLRLTSSNGNYRDILASEIEVLGRLIASGRWEKH